MPLDRDFSRNVCLEKKSWLSIDDEYHVQVLARTLSATRNVPFGVALGYWCPSEVYSVNFTACNNGNHLMAALIISNVTQLEQFPGSPSQQLVGQVSKNRVWKQVSWNLKIPPFAFFTPQKNCKGTHPSLENFFSSPDVVLFRGLNKPKGQMCHSNIIFHMHRAIKQMANV